MIKYKITVSIDGTDYCQDNIEKMSLQNIKELISFCEDIKTVKRVISWNKEAAESPEIDVILERLIRISYKGL